MEYANNFWKAFRMTSSIMNVAIKYVSISLMGFIYKLESYSRPKYFPSSTPW